MEAARAPTWGREITELGHEVKLIPPTCRRAARRNDSARRGRKRRPAASGSTRRSPSCRKRSVTWADLLDGSPGSMCRSRTCRRRSRERAQDEEAKRLMTNRPDLHTSLRAARKASAAVASRLAGPRAAPAHDGRQAEVGQDVPRPQTAAGPRRDAVIQSARRPETADPWLLQMLARKPKMVVAVALANRMARIVWALMTKKESYRASAPASA